MCIEIIIAKPQLTESGRNFPRTSQPFTGGSTVTFSSNNELLSSNTTPNSLIY